ncbi:MAG: class I SAM-dependent methyltransferase [Candidatus Paceibacterota bacterium]
MSFIDSFNQLSKTPSFLRSGRMFSFHLFLFKKIAREISLKLNLKKEDKILDVGSGTGDITQYIFPCSSITLSDNAPSALFIARQKKFFCPTDFKIVDLNKKLDFPNNQFSAVICYSVIHYLDNYNSLEKLFFELIRTTSPGGRILIGDIPLRDKYEANLKHRQSRPIINFIKNIQYYIKKETTNFFYRFYKINTAPSSLVITKPLLESILKNTPEIRRFSFLKQSSSLPFSDSREDLIIEKCL